MITKLNRKDKTIKSYAIRKLTPKECFRLMGVPDQTISDMQMTFAEATASGIPLQLKGSGDAMVISASQQYKQAGNSIVVDVLAAIYEQIWFPKAKPADQQTSFFDMFDAMEERPADNGTKNVITTFSGYDSQLMACKLLHQRHPEFSFDCRGWSEIDKYASQMHDLVFPEYADRALGDITKIDWQALKDSLNGDEIDLFTYSSPCFVTGTMVLTDKGYVEIENINTDHKVITHTNSYQNVLRPMVREYDGEILTIDAMCTDKIECTPEHPFYVRERYRYGHKSIRAFREPQWVEARNLTKNHYLGIAINQESKLPVWEGVIDNRWGHHRQSNKLSERFTDGNFWYLMGRYVGDGWSRRTSCYGSSIVICCSERNQQSLVDCLDSLSYHYTTNVDRTVTKIIVSSNELCAFVQRFGYKAYGKQIDAETLSLPVDMLRRFIEGYLDSDGSYNEPDYKITTVSRKLAYGLVQCIAKVYHRPARLYHSKRNPTCVIEGRVVNQRDTYQICWKLTDDIQDKAFYQDGYVWFPINRITSERRTCNVYNLESDCDHSYTANGVIVHNCQDISQAGKQMGLKEGSGSRSALLWNVSDAIEILRPKYLLQENVAALVSQKFMPDFQRWLDRLNSLGYVSYWTTLNAKDFGTPQNRDRVFCLSIRRDLVHTFSFPSPVPLEKKLEDILETEVDTRYFLNDQAVGKFLTANNTDDAIFVQFQVEPSHENAMFLKTWLQYQVDWDHDNQAILAKIESRKQDLYNSFRIFQTLGDFPSDDFQRLYDYNLHRNDNPDTIRPS